MKIDVEGFEKSDFRDAKATFGNESLHSVIIELNSSGTRYDSDERNIMDMMKYFGFSMYDYDRFSSQLHLNDNKGKRGNTLFVRDANLVREEVQRADHESINGTDF
jgi:hypothetical protein